MRRPGLRPLLPALAGLLAVSVLGACTAGSGEPTAAESRRGETSSGQHARTGDAALPVRRRSAVVARVVDGDTIALGSGREVRLVQIDAPEGDQGECYADEARAALRALLPEGARVRLEADQRLDKVDDYGRLLRYVFRGGRNLNLVLVRRGAATVWFFRGDRGRYATALLRAATQARAGKRGLWRACPGTPFDPEGPADTGTGTGSTASAGAEASCPSAIRWQEAKAHTGESATVAGPVAGTFYAADANGKPTFLNIGNDHPDPNRFTVVIWGDDRGKFPTPPEHAYAGKTICVSGTIELYEGVPEVEVSSPGQIAVAR